MSCPHLEVTTVRPDDYVKFLSSRIQDIANDAIASRGVFLLGVSGGSVIDVLAEGLPNSSTDWKSWRIFLCDERLVPADDPESTYGAYVQKLLPKIPEFPPENFLQANVSLSSEESAKDYEKRLRELWEAAGTNPNQVPYGMSDCLILGVGPDGHTCSLFPDHSVLEVKDSWVTFIDDSPKPPPRRITLTYPFINKATHIIVSAKGEQKAQIVKNLQKGADLPIGRVNNPGGRLEWILDHLVV